MLNMLRNGHKAMAGLALLLGMVLVSACNTVEGVGRDVRATGNAIEGAAKDAKR